MSTCGNERVPVRNAHAMREFDIMRWGSDASGKSSIVKCTPTLHAARTYLTHRVMGLTVLNRQFSV